MNKRYSIKSFVALLLAVCICMGCLPQGSMLPLILPAAQAEETLLQTAQEEPLHSGGEWLYRIREDGYAEVLGYSDASAVSLSIPTAIGGAWVTGIAAGAFADNAALQSLTIPATVAQISAEAFPNHDGLTIRAANGTAALAFAAGRGFDAVNTSAFDLFDDILDLSEMKSAQFTVTDGTVAIAAPYAMQITPGAKVFLPAIGSYANGLPIAVETVSFSGSAAMATFSVLEFSEAIETYSVENVALTPDYDNVIILADGFRMLRTMSRDTASLTLNPKIEFSVDYEINDNMSVKGKISYAPEYTFDLEYGWFEIQSFSYNSESTSKLELSFKNEQELFKVKDSDVITFARVPLTSPTLVSVWLDLSLSVSMEGEISIETSITTTESFKWIKGEEPASNKTRRVDAFSLSAAVSIGASFNVTVAVNLGFSGTGFSTDVVQIKASIGVEAKASVSSDYPECCDLEVEGKFSVSIKIGLLSGKIKPAVDLTLFTQKWNIWSKHVEILEGEVLPSFLDDCTKQCYVKLVPGTSYSIEELKVEPGTKITGLSIPVRDGHIFMGWFTDLDLTDQWDFANDVVTKSIILYAGWMLADGTVVPPDPGPGPDDDDGDLEYLQYSIENGGVTIMGYTGTPVSVTIPDKIEDLPVTKIGSSAFQNCDSLVYVKIPNSVKVISAGAFRYCDSLEQVILPVNWLIGNTSGMAIGSPFDHCPNLKKIVIPEGTTEIGLYSFYDVTSLESVSLPDTLVKIDTCAFYGCTGLTHVTIPDGVTTINDRAFVGCSNLASVDLPAGWTTITGASYSPFGNCPKLTSLTIPEGATVIPYGAFRNMYSLRSITLPGTLKKISFYAFADCDSLTVFDAAHTALTVIEQDAFRGCGALQTVSLPKTLTTIGRYAFDGCTALEKLTLREGLSELGAWAFARCSSLTEASLPDSLSTIGTGAFQDCTSLKKVRLPASWKDQGVETESPWKGCTSLSTVVIPEGATVLPKYALQGLTAIKTLTFPSTMISIGAAACYGCTGLESVSLNSGLKTIDNYAFADCDSLTSISIPDSVSYLYNKAFDGCDNLSHVDLPVSWSTSGYGAPFTNCPKLTTLALPEGMTECHMRMLQGMTSLEIISFPSTLKKISSYAFCDCSALQTVIIPANTTVIDPGAFMNCTSLRSVYVPAKVAIDDSAFLNCNAIAAVYSEYTGPYSASDHFVTRFPNAKIESLADQVIIVTYVTSGGTHVPSVYAAVGGLLAVPNTPSRADYAFTGWYTDSACTDLWDFAADTVPSVSMKLYAGWDYVPEGFTYELSSQMTARPGETGMATITAYRGTATDLVLPARYGSAVVTALGEGAIPDTVATVTIPAGITSIDQRAFRWATSLTSIAVDADNPVYRAVDGVLYTRDGMLVACPRGKAGTLNVAADTTAIGAYAISGCDGLTAISMPATALTLGEYAIHDCESLTGVTFAADAAQIGTGCFLGCPGLRITGPLNAPNLAAWADACYLSYNEYAVSYMQNGELLGAMLVRAGEPIGEPMRPEEGEMTFFGWSLTEDGTTLWDFATGVMPAQDMALHAVWRYDFITEAVEGGVQLTAYTGVRDTVLVPEMIDGLPVVSIAADAFPDASVTLTGNRGSVTESYAQAQGMTFVPLTYTVTFAANGGSYAAPRTLSATETVVQPECVRTGYQLTGWYTDSALTTLWDFAADRMPAADLTLYAGWEQTDANAVAIPFTFDTTAEGLVITGYTGAMGAAVIPATVNGEPVVAIGPDAFRGQQALLQVTIPGSVKQVGTAAFAQSRIGSVVMESGVTAIGDYAFSDCAELGSVILPETITTIGTAAFQNCTALTAIALPDGLTVMADNLFSGCTYLGGVSLPDALEEIGSAAFADCRSLTALHLGAHVSEVAQDALIGCTALAEVRVAEDNLYYTDVDGVLLSGDGTQLLLYPAGRADSAYSIPDSVTAIGASAMAGSRIAALTLNDALCTIGAGGLRGCVQLTQITFAENGQLTAIGESAFSGCISLRRIAFPDTLTSIGAAAFASSGLREASIPAQTVIGAQAFRGTDGLTIYGSAGSNAQLHALANGVRFIDLSTDIPVTGVTLPDALTLNVGDTMALAAVLTPADTTETALVWRSSDAATVHVDADGLVSARQAGTAAITVTAANGSSATCYVTAAVEAVQPEKILLSADEVTLEPGMLYPLTATVLPAGSVGANVTWTSSASAVTVYVNGCVSALSYGTATLTAATDSGLTAVCTVRVHTPFGTPDMVLPDDLLAIEAEAFAGIPVTVARCPDGLESIGARAFADCTELAQIMIPASVTSIDSTAFAGCKGLLVYGEAGSAAEAFAATQGFIFLTE